MSLSKRIATGMIAGLVLVALVPAATAGARDSGCSHMDSTERAFKQKIDSARGSSRVDLRADWDLNEVALKHTREMVARNKLYHTSENAFSWRVTNWSMLGENVGVGDSVNELHKAFMSSSGHRANVLSNSFNRVGIGVVEHNGRMWVTFIFQARSNPGTPLC